MWDREDSEMREWKVYGFSWEMLIFDDFTYNFSWEMHDVNLSFNGVFWASDEKSMKSILYVEGDRS